MKLLPTDQMSSSNIETRILCLVISFSFFKAFSPIVSYWVPYMVQVKGLTNLQISKQVLPVYTYATLVCTLIAAPACELLSWKKIIVAGQLASMLSILLFRFGESMIVFVIMEVASACSAASSFIYQAYLFLLVTEENFQTMTGFSKASGCMALFLSAELGQILVLCGTSYYIIVYITMAVDATACLISFLLPSADAKDRRENVMPSFYSKSQGFWLTVKATWKDKGLQLLSIWWALATAGLQLSLNYSTTLFAAIDPISIYNGHVVAIATAFAVIMSLTSVYLKRALTRMGGFVYIVGSILYGALCLGLAYTRTLWIAYVLFIVMVGIEMLLVCFLYAQCGSLVKNDKYALMFSLNCGLGNVAQAALQAVLEVGSRDIYAQYVIIGIFFMIVAVFFAVPYSILCIRRGTLEISSVVESGPDPIKVESVHQPLLAAEEPV